ARLVSAGDSRAFEALYRRHTDMLYATAVRITGDRDAAADVVHDAWVRVVETGARFEHRSAFRTWVTGILLNVIRERARDASRTRGWSDADARVADDSSLGAPSETGDAFGLDVAAVDPIDLDAAIAALPNGFRKVLVLHDVEGFTHDEIAELLHIMPGTSKSQLVRARQRVRQLLGEHAPRRAK
ncbi:MAG: polymerase sigma factor, sigma-70 family, partial [Geminicoccaceae bacterium]|nr:polymerase sigma factor, sigma-70 family [Geminicoccaceae bacterium]